MLFSSTVFLFCFLPLLLTVYFFSPNRAKNTILLTASLFFYAWGELFYTGLMALSIGANYLFGRLVDKSLLHKKQFLALGVACNLLLLGFFKYANFIADNLNTLLALFTPAKIELQAVHLPSASPFLPFKRYPILSMSIERGILHRKTCSILASISLFFRSSLPAPSFATTVWHGNWYHVPLPSPPLRQGSPASYTVWPKTSPGQSVGRGGRYNFPPPPGSVAGRCGLDRDTQLYPADLF